MQNIRLTDCLSAQEKRLRQQKKAKLAAKTKLSFAQEEDEEDDADLNGSAEVRLHACPLLTFPVHWHVSIWAHIAISGHYCSHRPVASEY